jgi:AraC family transcriptional regulator, transcriptional activator of pobA
MLVVTTIENLFIIHHSARHQATGYTCIFHKNFLTATAWRRIRSLAMPGRAQPFYALNHKQDRDLNDIMQKMMNEKNSDYIFSKDLQRTYIVELLHFIVKIRQQH